MSGRQTDEAETGQQQRGPENRQAAEKATQENDLSTGHSDLEDGGDDNAKSDTKRRDS